MHLSTKKMQLSLAETQKKLKCNFPASVKITDHSAFYQKIHSVELTIIFHMSTYY
jgi:hypothetical protein